MAQANGTAISVSFNSKRCIHARRCVLGLPDVFRPGTKGGWIFPDNAQAEEIARIIDSCPSGALQYERHDGGTQEPMPKVNTLRLWENGPNELRGDLKLPGDQSEKRVLLCRCGQSKNKPFCDNSHIAAEFVATADVESTDKVETPDTRDGHAMVKPLKDGPVMVTGQVEVIAASGRRIATGEKFALCRCGASKNKPFCDGSHVAIGFEAD